MFCTDLAVLRQIAAAWRIIHTGVQSTGSRLHASKTGQLSTSVVSSSSGKNKYTVAARPHNSILSGKTQGIFVIPVPQGG